MLEHIKHNNDMKPCELYMKLFDKLSEMWIHTKIWKEAMRNADMTPCEVVTQSYTKHIMKLCEICYEPYETYDNEAMQNDDTLSCKIVIWSHMKHVTKPYKICNVKLYKRWWKSMIQSHKNNDLSYKQWYMIQSYAKCDIV